MSPARAHTWARRARSGPRREDRQPSQRARSASASRSQLQSTTARSVWCRGSAVPAAAGSAREPVGQAGRRARARPSCACRAAASSMASGMPVEAPADLGDGRRRRPQSSAKPGRTRRPGRRTARAAAGLVEDGSPATRARPATPSGSRLVASTARRAGASSCSTSSATAPRGARSCRGPAAWSGRDSAASRRWRATPGRLACAGVGGRLCAARVVQAHCRAAQRGQDRRGSSGPAGAVDAKPPAHVRPVRDDLDGQPGLAGATGTIERDQSAHRRQGPRPRRCPARVRRSS